MFETGTLCSLCVTDLPLLNTRITQR